MTNIDFCSAQTPVLGKTVQEEEGVTEDEMVGWHRWINGRECERTPGDGEGQGSLAYAVHGVTKSCTQLSN